MLTVKEFVVSFLSSLFKKEEVELPWMLEGKKVFGMHEIRDNKKLREWLRSDGKTLGDPSQLPWCGDYVETAIKNSLPTEPFTGDLEKNPYWARNWSKFGKQILPCYGAIMVFSRGSGGHVGFAVGEDNNDFYILGGNQSNAVTISRIAKNRLLASRWPKTYTGKTKILPRMSPTNIPRTTNEF